MSNSIFLPKTIDSETKNHTPADQTNCHSYSTITDSYDDHHQADLELLEYISLLNQPAAAEETPISSFTTTTNPSQIQSTSSASSFNPVTTNLPRNCHIKCESELKRVKMDVGFRIAFRTKSVMEIMDDGFKWRKYGRKSVKSSPNPRNYYKCSKEGCKVKKRVERDGEDPNYVITTYEGVHNHESPSSSSFV